MSVIYIDDDALNLKVIRDILTSFGMSVTCCRTPREGLDLLAVRAFDVALIDIHMPEMSGIELLRELRRKIGPNRGAPALALTADVSRDEMQYRELGFDGFIAKPVVIKSLLAKILAVLSATLEAEAAGRQQATLAAPRKSA